MVRKKGFVRTLEAVIAVILLLGIIYVLIPKQVITEEHTNNLEQAHELIFAELSINATFRNCLTRQVSTEGSITELQGIAAEVTHSCIQNTQLPNFIQAQTPRGYQSFAEVCSTSRSCTNVALPVNKSVYADSMLLAARDARVFRVYFWEK